MFSIKNIWRKIKKTENVESKDDRDISNIWNKETQEEIKRYEAMLAEVATAPGHCSFYSRLCNANDIPGLGGEYLGDICYCPRCKQQMEKKTVVSGCGAIYSFYCNADNLHWVLDCYGLVAPGTLRKWYGPFPGMHGWAVSNGFWKERVAEMAKH
jgi:hypothetical protein